LYSTSFAGLFRLWCSFDVSDAHSTTRDVAADAISRVQMMPEAAPGNVVLADKIFGTAQLM
jgi:hypothetical protein